VLSFARVLAIGEAGRSPGALPAQCAGYDVAQLSVINELPIQN